MSRFLTPLRARLVSYDQAGRPVWELEEDLVFLSDRHGLIRAPARFRTNYASVPRLPVIFLVAGDRAHAPACLHDKGYTDHGGLSREQWDAIFLEALAAPQVVEVQKPVPAWLQATMHRAVRVFGGSAWSAPSTIVQPDTVQP